MIGTKKQTIKSSVKDTDSKKNKREFSALSIMQNIGKSLVFPIATLPAAALLLRLGAFIGSYGFIGVDAEGIDATTAQIAWHWIGFIMMTPGAAVFDNLPLIFGVGVAFGFAKENRGEVALVGVLAYLALIGLAQNEGSMSQMIYGGVNLGNAGSFDGAFRSDLLYLNIKIDGEIVSSTWLMNFGVFGGILTGLVSALLYNKFSTVVLPPALGFFSGRRLVPIVTLFFMILVALAMAILWPWVNIVLIYFSIGISFIPAIGAGLYGFVNRLLIPFGLHQILNTYFWFQTPIVTSLQDFDGSLQLMYATKLMISDGVGFLPLLGDINAFSAIVEGTQFRFAGDSPLAGITFVISSDGLDYVGGDIPGAGIYDIDYDIDTIEILAEEALFGANIGMYQSGFYPTMMFGLPAVGVAMAMKSEDEHKTAVWAFMASAGGVAFLTGITEPLEFAFMFISPIIYLVYAILTGVYATIVVSLGISVGFGFSAGLIDWVLSAVGGGVGYLSTVGNWANLELLAIGVGAGLINFVVVYFLITKFDIATPGRHGNIAGLTNDDSDDASASVVIDTDINKSSKNGAKGKNKAKIERMAKQTIDLVGVENILKVDNCITRVRLTVIDNSKYKDEDAVKIGYSAVVKVGKKTYQLIIGPDSEWIANEMTRLISEGYGKK